VNLLIVDNYDSFTYNLVHLFGPYRVELSVLRNDDAALDEDAIEWADAVVLGPGPGRPGEAGRLLQTIDWAVHWERPLFGVCLGQQAIAEYFGGSVVHAPALVHGKTSAIEHDGSGVFRGIPSPLSATRYHSLCVSDLPGVLGVCARSADGVVQGIAHATLPIYGVQFHPESVLTVQGPSIARNFLELAAR
jgi:anthranilate synthase/aminodeoxychorismate synthase-like glutamine amidotransferase